MRAWHRANAALPCSLNWALRRWRPWVNTPEGPIHDIDVFDNDGDGKVTRTMSNTFSQKLDETWNGGKVPWGDDSDRGICALDLNPWEAGSTQIPWW
jgi:hypothetical protein